QRKTNIRVLFKHVKERSSSGLLRPDDCKINLFHKKSSDPFNISVQRTYDKCARRNFYTLPSRQLMTKQKKNLARPPRKEPSLSPYRGRKHHRCGKATFPLAAAQRQTR